MQQTFNNHDQSEVNEGGERKNLLEMTNSTKLHIMSILTVLNLNQTT
jgi:hypothetical protein